MNIKFRKWFEIISVASKSHLNLIAFHHSETKTWLLKIAITTESEMIFFSTNRIEKSSFFKSISNHRSSPSKNIYSQTHNERNKINSEKGRRRIAMGANQLFSTFDIQCRYIQYANQYKHGQVKNNKKTHKNVNKNIQRETSIKLGFFFSCKNAMKKKIEKNPKKLIRFVHKHKNKLFYDGK